MKKITIIAIASAIVVSAMFCVSCERDNEEKETFVSGPADMGGVATISDGEDIWLPDDTRNCD